MPWKVRSWGETSKGLGWQLEKWDPCREVREGVSTLGPGSLGAHHDGISEGHNVDRPHGAEAGQDGKDDIVPRFLGTFAPFHPRPCQLGAGMTA